jgi:transcriptional regulator with XRE-family HTH domain
MKVDNNIKKHRVSKNLSQKDLANMVGVDRSFITRVESGERQLSVARLIQIADILECSLDELTGRNIDNIKST